VTAVPANVLIIPYPNFIRATPDSAPELGASRRLLLAFVAAMREARLHHVLIDIRPSALTPLPENRCGQAGVAVGARCALAEERVAVVVPQDAYDDARLIEGIDRVEGAQIQVFTDFETAIGWLNLRER
jgi:hypothetical protein